MNKTYTMKQATNEHAKVGQRLFEDGLCSRAEYEVVEVVGMDEVYKCSKVMVKYVGPRAEASRMDLKCTKKAQLVNRFDVL